MGPQALAAAVGHRVTQTVMSQRNERAAAPWDQARSLGCRRRGVCASLRMRDRAWLKLVSMPQFVAARGRGALRVSAINIQNFDRQKKESEEEETPAQCPAKPCWADKFLRIPEEGLVLVPWGLKTVITNETVFLCPLSPLIHCKVMIAWFASFFIVGHFVLPWLAAIAGMDRFSMTERGMAVYSLCTDVVELVVGLGVVKFALRRFSPLPPGWFPLTLKGNAGWLRDVGIASLAFPVVSGLSRLSTEMLPFIGESGAWEQSVTGGDFVASMLYVMVVSVFAPVWEEVIFRGFLLPSLARYMSMDFALVVSALVFAAAHFSWERLLPLSLLGIVMGALYIRSRTLLAPMLLHSLWNAYAFLEVLVFH